MLSSFEDEMAAVRSWRSTAGYASDDEVESRTPDEAESALSWLEQTGSPIFHDIAKQYMSGDSDLALSDFNFNIDNQLMSRKHFNAVLRRIATLKVKRAATKKDIRDVFGASSRSASASAQSSDGDFDEEDCADTQNTISSNSQGMSHSQPQPTTTGQNTSTTSLTTVSTETSGLEAYTTFVVPYNKLGNTMIEHLSEKDISNIRNLAHLELAALFDKFELSPAFRKAKSKRRTKDTGYFGVNLDNLVNLKKTSDRSDKVSEFYDSLRAQNADKLTEFNDFACNKYVPDLVVFLVQFLRQHGLRTEGILRVPGSFVRIRELRDAIETHGVQYLLDVREELDVHDAAGLLKGFLRELPSPLTGISYSDFFLNLHKITTPMSKLVGLNLLILLLPTPNSRVLRILIELFLEIVQNFKLNRMNLKALSTVVSPNLFTALNVSKRQDRSTTLTYTHNLIEIVEMMIKYKNIVWSVPDFLMKMLRDPCCSSRKNILKKVKKASSSSQEPHRPSSPVFQSTNSSLTNTLTILLTVEGSSNMCKFKSQVPVTTTTLAQQIVDKFQTGTGPALALYETGGNLCERRLPGNTQVHAVLQENPSCHWTVKPI